MIISFYQGDVYKEHCLPNADNIDHDIILEPDMFPIKRHFTLKLENSDGKWFLKKNSCVEEAFGDDGRLEIADGKIIQVRLENAPPMQMIVSQGLGRFVPYKKYSLRNSSRFTVGKGDENDICFDKPLVSKKQCLIYRNAGAWYVSDMSTNGLFINNRKVHDAMPLKFGDVVNIFGLEIIYLDETVAVGSRIGEFTVNDFSLAPAELPEMTPLRAHVIKRVYSRSPRTIPHVFDEKIEVESPPALQVSKKASLLQTIGPSFTMALPMLLGCIIAIYSSSRSGNSSGAFMYTGIITAVGSASLGAFWGFRNLKAAKKEERTEEERRFNAYSDYLIKKTNEIQEKYINNVNAVNATYPSAKEMCEYSESSKTLWNRNFSHKDFLYHRLGLGEEPFACELITPKQRFSLQYDALQDKPEILHKEYSVMHNVPVGIDLQENNFYGIIGAAGKQGAINVMYNLAVQIAANNCYTDVKMVFIYNEKTPSNRKAWEFFRWFPHVNSEDNKLRYIASNKLEAADVFFDLANIIRKRLDAQENNMGGTPEPARPHYVIFIEDMELLEGEPITKYLLNNKNTYGVTTFILSEYYYDLPNMCENIIQNDEYGSYIYNAMDTENEKKAITFDTVTAADVERLARSLSEVRIAESDNDSEIPNSLSFLDMYGVSTLEELNVVERWKKNRTYNTMRALVGKKAGGADCYLDIHEKYHGPHGLVAGTTGSGKSETLQTYILSLALNFGPDDVGFFIIDFKGGGMANLFSGLPHMLGQISNLSGNQITRAMVSIKSEIKRRQIIFTEHSVNNINAYTNLYKAKESTVPVPHLLIVIDEFAEMKREEPEFMKELISVAQVGRSLGIHLILATQKPSGTVDDNIWSNTKFKLCLRVQSRGDSMDMLHKPDAAYLTQAGRCYLQVGSDEIFELFQSGWSGADYDPQSNTGKSNAVTMLTLTGKTAIVGNRAKTRLNEEKKKRWITSLLYQYGVNKKKYGLNVSQMDSFLMDEFVNKVIDELKQRGFGITNSPAEKKQMEDFFKKLEEEKLWGDSFEQTVDTILRSNIKLPELKEVSQLDATVDYLNTVSRKLGIVKQPSLWMPPLSASIYLNDIEAYRSTAYSNGKWADDGGHWSLEGVIGICDDPENQDQLPLSIDLAQKGHSAVIGSVVSGKSTFLQTALYSLCSKYSPAHLNTYILDFSSHSLAPFAKAPHCGGVFSEDNIDQIGKLFNMIQKIIAERKKLFTGGSYAQYVRAYGVKLPSIIIVIDNFAAFSEKTEGKFEQFLITLSREGVGFGIYLMVSAAGFGMSEIPNRIADNLGSVFTLNLGDKFKYMDVLRTTSLAILPENDITGRGLASVSDRFLEYQTALCTEAEDGYKRLETIESILVDMDNNWQGRRAPEVPSIPENPTQSIISKNAEYDNKLDDPTCIPIGYRLVDASIHSIQLSKTYCYVITGKQRTGKTNLLKLMMAGVARRDGEIAVYENGTGELVVPCKEMNGRYLTTSSEIFSFFSDLLPEFAKRNKLKKELIAKGCTEEEIFEQMSKEKPYFIFINDMVGFINNIYMPEPGVQDMSKFFENIIDKGELHNIYFIGCVDIDKALEVSGFEGYRCFVKYKKGMHLGGNLSQQQLFSFANIPFQETTRGYKKGLGVCPSYEDEAVGLKIIIPAAGR